MTSPTTDKLVHAYNRMMERVRQALDSNQMTIIVCKCESGNIKVPVIQMDPVVIRDRFMKKLEQRNA